MAFLLNLQPAQPFQQTDQQPQAPSPFQRLKLAPIQPLKTQDLEQPATQQPATPAQQPAPSSTPSGPTTAGPTTSTTTSSTTGKPITGTAYTPGAPTQQPTLTAPKSVATTPAAPEAPKVTGDVGRRSDERDPTTNIVLDPNANNKPVNTVAKTYVADDGTVHYVRADINGKPRSPTADKEGWAKLTTEQQRAALEDYKTNLQAWQEKQSHTAAGIPDYLTEDSLSQMDPDGQLAAVDQFLTGTAPKAAAPSLTVSSDGNVRYTEKDADGNLVEPWTLEGWDKLTPEQQQAARATYAVSLQKQQQTAATTPNDDTNYAGLGISRADFEKLTPDQQVQALQTGKVPKPPVNNGNGTYTYTQDDGSVQTRDTTGKITYEKTTDGTEITYGDGPAKTTITADGKKTVVDSHGNTTVTYVPGSAAETTHIAMQGTGFNDDGTRLSSLDAWAKSKGLDPTKLTAQQLDAYKADITKNNVDNWSTGESIARAAVSLGLLSRADYLQMSSSDAAHSFGAWLARNGDIALAVKASNAPKEKNPVALQYWQQNFGNTGQLASDDSDAYFDKVRGGQGYVAPDAYAYHDYSNVPAASSYNYASPDPLDSAAIYGKWQELQQQQRDNIVSGVPDFQTFLANYVNDPNYASSFYNPVPASSDSGYPAPFYVSPTV